MKRSATFLSEWLLVLCSSAMAWLMRRECLFMKYRIDSRQSGRFVERRLRRKVRNSFRAVVAEIEIGEGRAALSSARRAPHRSIETLAGMERRRYGNIAPYPLRTLQAFGMRVRRYPN